MATASFADEGLLGQTDALRGVAGTFDFDPTAAFDGLMTDEIPPTASPPRSATARAEMICVGVILSSCKSLTAEATDRFVNEILIKAQSS